MVFVIYSIGAAMHVHLVIHYADISKMKSDLLKGDYKDRRMTYFTNMEDIQSTKKELQRIMNKLVKFIDNK